MIRYVYKAKDGPGRTVEGEIEAESRLAAAARIDAMGLSPVLIREKDAEGESGRDLFGWFIRGRDITIFTRQLASLLRAGVPILKGLLTIGEQTERRAMRRVVLDLEATIRGGSMLSEALARHPRQFDELYVNMVRSGESGGILDAILARLTEMRETEEELRRKVQSSMAYPVLILVSGLGTILVMLTFFLPRVAELFDGFGELPLPTRFILATSAFLKDSWHWLAIGTALVVVVWNRLAALDKGRTLADRVRLGVPILGRFIRLADTARFARTLGLLLQSGIPIDRALTLSGKTLRNRIIRDEIEAIRVTTVKQGLPVSEGLRRSRLFPRFVAHMAAVGEESGRLDESLAEVATYYEKEVDHYSRLMTSLIEPVLILVVGLMVGVIVAAMLLPIFKLSTVMR